MDFQDGDSIEWIIPVPIGARGQHKAVLTESQHLALYPVGNLSTGKGISHLVQTVEQDVSRPV